MYLPKLWLANFMMKRLTFGALEYFAMSWVQERPHFNPIQTKIKLTTKYSRCKFNSPFTSVLKSLTSLEGFWTVTLRSEWVYKMCKGTNGWRNMRMRLGEWFQKIFGTVGWNYAKVNDLVILSLFKVRNDAEHSIE